jgi:hypothetical protein
MAQNWGDNGDIRLPATLGLDPGCQNWSNDKTPQAWREVSLEIGNLPLGNPSAEAGHTFQHYDCRGERSLMLPILRSELLNSDPSCME